MSRTVRIQVTGALVAAGLLIGALVTSPSALAAPRGTLVTTPSGMVGVPQALLVRAPGSTGQTVALQLTTGPAVQTVSVPIAANGFGQVDWIPAGAGSWSITGTGAIAGVATSIDVAPAPTYTRIAAPSPMQRGVTAQIAAFVTAPIGSLAPAGAVTFTVPNGKALGTVTVRPGYAPNIAYATVPFTPDTTGLVEVQATYVPSSGGQLASTSPVGTALVTNAAVVVAPRWPSVVYAGEPVQLQAVAAPGQPEGIVSFTFSTGGTSGPVGTQFGVASYFWYPTTAGVQNITTGFERFKDSAAGAGMQAMNIRPARPVDTLAVGTAQQGAWSTTTPFTMKANQVFALTGTSASGTPVLFSRTGPCAINGNVLSAVGTGTCTVTAITPGTATIRPGSQTYQVTITPRGTK